MINATEVCVHLALAKNKVLYLAHEKKRYFLTDQPTVRLLVEALRQVSEETRCPTILIHIVSEISDCHGEKPVERIAPYLVTDDKQCYLSSTPEPGDEVIASSGIDASVQFFLTTYIFRLMSATGEATIQWVNPQYEFEPEASTA